MRLKPLLSLSSLWLMLMLMLFVVDVLLPGKGIVVKSQGGVGLGCSLVTYCLPAGRGVSWPNFFSRDMHNSLANHYYLVISQLIISKATSMESRG